MFKILLLCLIFQTSAFAYLDPASGSLLLSSIVAIFASIVFALKGAFYKITKISPAQMRMGGGRSQNAAIVIYSEDDRYYFVFKPILDAFDALCYPYTFYTSDKNDRALLRQNSSGHFEFIGEGNKAYTKLNMLKADMLILTAPGLNILHIKRTRNVKHYCHIVHSTTPMTYRIFGIDYFDSVLVANEIQRDFVREVEAAHNVAKKHIEVVGYPFLDESFKQSQKIKAAQNNPITLPNPHARTILVSPTWGKESLLAKFGMRLLLPLAKSPFNIIIRPHPQSMIGQEAANIARLQDELREYKNIIWDIGTPNIYAFDACDAMISDFSSVIFDFVCLEQKPVFTIDFEFDPAGYDVDDVEDFWTFAALNKIGARIKESDFENIAEIIGRAQEVRHDELKSAKDALWRYQFEGEARIARAILALHKNILYSELGALAPLARQIEELDSQIEILDSKICAQNSATQCAKGAK